MKKLTLFTALLIACLLTFGQSKITIVFDEKTYDFGDITAGSGNVTHTFTFTNAGTEPIIVSNVKASCGCTTPKWTKEPVMPGEKGTIEVTYTSTRVASPKPFTKSVTVTSNANPASTALIIKGHVIEKAPEFSQGVTSIDSIDFGQVKKKSVTKTFEITNEGNKALNIKSTTQPESMEVTLSSTVINAGEKITVTVTLDPRNITSIDDFIIIKTDSSKTHQLKVKVIATKK